jgi:hypothetical protein
MAILLKDLMENPNLLVTEGPKCPHCGVLLQETITGKRMIGEEEVCSDCYYERLGDLVEQHPITSGRIPRS